MREDVPIGTQAKDVARRTVTSDTLDRLARLGLACRGVLYALVGILALQIAFGGGSQEEADKHGAIKTVAEQPFGTGLLWLLMIGLAALVVWQLLSATIGRPKLWDRVKCVGRALVYGFVVVSIISLLLSGGGESGDQQSRDITRSLLELPAGVVLVVAAGAALIWLGGFWVYRGVTKRFMKHLRTAQMSQQTQTVVETLGLVGYVCRGAVAAVAGIFIARAALTYDPEEAKGLDATLRSFADTPAGPWLLAAVAVGLLVFAVYCFCEARWHHVGPSGG